MLNYIKNMIGSTIRMPPSDDHYVEQFKTELALIKGTHKNKNNHPSIIHFSFNKAATQYIKSILNRCAIENGMAPVGIHDYAFDSNFPYLDQLSLEEMGKYKHIFKSRGYLYSAFGGMIEGIPNLENYKIVLVARDPRDILVSGYYSIIYSHVIPSKNGNKADPFMQRRLAASELNIDEYVLAESERVYKNFTRYQSLLLDNYKTTYLTKYEQMVSDFEIWLTDLLKYCELDLKREFIQYLIRENKAKRPQEEDVTKHTRKGLPGDYKNKLQPETVQALNEKFDPILKRFQYQ